MKYLIIIGAVVGLALILTIEFSRRRKIETPARQIAAQPVQKDTPKQAAPAWSEASGIVVKGQTFTDSVLKVAGKIPAGWELQAPNRRGDIETSLTFSQPAHPKSTLTVYYRLTERNKAFDRAQAVESLRKAVQEKIEQRIAGGLIDYKLASEVVVREIHGNPAVSWSANFLRDGVAWNESLTRIQAESYTMLFFLMAPTTELEAVKPGYDELTSTTGLL